MKWVYIGLFQSALLVTAAAFIDRKHAKAIVAGGAIAGGAMYFQYAHAKKAGLKSNEPGTEGSSGPGWLNPKGV